jgi:hypothetical protein
MSRLSIPDTGFAERCAAIRPTLEYYDLYEPTTFVIGGAALALAGIDAHVPGLGPKFDIDALVPMKRLLYLKETDPYCNVWKKVDPPGTLNLYAMFVENNPIRSMIPAEMYRDMLNNALPPREDRAVRILHPAKAAVNKVYRGEPKDIIGLIQGHILAYEENHPIIRDPDWQGVIAEAAIRLPWAISDLDNHAPEWTLALVNSGLEHEALATIPRTTS